MSSSTKDLSIDFTAGIDDTPSEQPFSWLKFPEKWTPDNLLNDIDSRTQKRYCKVCDDHVHPWDAEDHITEHIADEYARLERRKEAAAEARELAREIEREEKRLQREATKPDNPKPVKAKSTRTRKPRGSLKTIALDIPEGEFTIAQIEATTGLAKHEVRTSILARVAAGELMEAGTVKSGGRGRPALLYARNKS